MITPDLARRSFAPSPRTVFLLPPATLVFWGGTFLYLAQSGRLRVLLHPLFWPLEIASGFLLIALAIGYLLCFRPRSAPVDLIPSRRLLLQTSALVLPLLLANFCAPASFSAAALERRAGLSGGRILAQSASPAGHPAVLELIDLAAAAYYPEHIPEVSGRHVSYVGQYFPGTDTEFRFCRVLMSCCAQDATPLYLHIVGPAPRFQEMQWITVEGDTFFRKDDGDWTPCIRLAKVSPASPPLDPYLYPVRARPTP